MQSALSIIWTRVPVTISYDDNYYTRGTSNSCFMYLHFGRLPEDRDELAAIVYCILQKRKKTWSRIFSTFDLIEALSSWIRTISTDVVMFPPADGRIEYTVSSWVVQFV